MWFESLLSPLSFVLSPDKRIYWGYLLVSLILAAILTGKQLFQSSLWFNRSSAIDVTLMFINQWLYKLLVVPFFALQISYAFSLNQALKGWFGEGDWILFSSDIVMFLFTLALFVSQDFAKFLIHYLCHRWPLLWRFHRVHHSATTLTPLTLYRIHPVEMLINACRSFVVTVLITAVFLYAFKNQLSLMQVLGVNAFVFIFNIAASNLRHSPVYIGFGVLEKFFISPAQHQIHHSAERAHYDKNFGSALSVWDRWFGTCIFSQGESVNVFGFAQPLKDNKGS